MMSESLLAQPIPRRMILAGAAALGAAARVSAQDFPNNIPDGQARPEISTIWEFAAQFRWDRRADAGVFVGGRRIVNNVMSGTVRGPRIEAEILPGGGDWAHANPPEAWSETLLDQHVDFDARYVFKTTDGRYIFVTNHGHSNLPGEIRQRRSRGEQVTWRSISSPAFDAPTGSEFEWMNHHVFIGVSQALQDATHMDVFRVEVANS